MMSNEQQLEQSNSPLLHVTIKDASEVPGLIYGKRGVRVAVIGAAFHGHLPSLIKVIHAEHPDINVVITEKAPPVGTPLIIEDLSPIPKFELVAMEPMGDISVLHKDINRPWKSRHKNNYKSKRRRGR